MQLQKFQDDVYIHAKEKEETNQRCVLSKENPQLFFSAACFSSDFSS
jgi:hypothetical protein